MFKKNAYKILSAKKANTTSRSRLRSNTQGKAIILPQSDNEQKQENTKQKKQIKTSKNPVVKEVDTNNEQKQIKTKNTIVKEEETNTVKEEEETNTVEENTNTVEENTNTIEEEETNTVEEKLVNIIDKDTRLIFDLNALSSVQPDEKLTVINELISVDDRYYLQGFRRWWNSDSRNKSANVTLNVINNVHNRISVLLDEDYESKLYKNKNNNKNNNNNNLETTEEKKYREICEKRKKLIKKYIIALTNAKKGIENCRNTYSDNFTKNKFNISIQKIDEILNLSSITF